MPQTKSTIHFTAALDTTNGAATTGALLNLPKSSSVNLHSDDKTIVEGTINGYPFRAALERTNQGSHSLKLGKSLLAAAAADASDTVTVEITRIADEPEPRLPTELQKALATSPRAQATWTETTPIARRDWILWITSAKQAETRLIRIEKACSMLASGKRRVCCFGGLNWLTKDHPSVETWLPLPKPKTTVPKKP